MEEGREIGYRRMRLDSVPSIMGTAVALYGSMSFGEIPDFRVNPIAGAICMELQLDGTRAITKVSVAAADAAVESAHYAI